MIVTGAPAGGAPRSAGRRASADGPAFRIDGPRLEPAPEPVRIPSAAILALQEAGQEPPEDYAARRHGERMLAELSAFQLALLVGGPGSESAARLAALAAGAPAGAAPALREVVAGIALRAAIEAARRK